MGLTTIFFSSFVIAFSGAMMPGPMFTATMLMSSTKGTRAGPLIVMGHGTLEAILVALLYAGFGRLFKDHILMGCIGVAGSAALLWMAYEAFRFREKSGIQTGGKFFGRSPYVAGVVTSLSNPYWIIWWITIGLSSIVLSFPYGIRGVITFYAGHILADLVWYTIVAVAFSFMKRFISSRGFRVIAAVSGAVFAGFAVYFLWFGIQNFR